jgi:hypothetical protein
MGQQELPELLVVSYRQDLVVVVAGEVQGHRLVEVGVAVVEVQLK